MIYTGVLVLFLIKLRNACELTSTCDVDIYNCHKFER